MRSASRSGAQGCAANGRLLGPLPPVSAGRLAQKRDPAVLRGAIRLRAGMSDLGSGESAHLHF